MAINDFNLGLIGKLDGTKSKHQLNNDIEALKKQLNNVEITAKLDPKVLGSIQIQLQNLQFQLNNVTLSQSALNGLVSQINSALQHEIQISGVNLGNIGNQAHQMGQQIGQQISQGVAQGINNNEQILNSFRNSLQRINSSNTTIAMDDSQIENVVQDVENLGLRLESVKESMSTINGRRGARNVLSVAITGVDELGQAVSLTRQYNANTGELTRSVDALSSATQKANSQLENLTAQQISKQQSLRNQLKQIYESAKNPNADRSITNKANLDKIEDQYTNITNRINDMRRSSKVAFAEQEAEISGLITSLKTSVKNYRDMENVRTSLKPDKLAEGISKAQSRWKSLETQINNANLNFEDKNLQKLNEQITNIRNNIKTIESGGILNKSEVESLHTALTNAKHELDALVQMKTSNSSLETIRLQAETLKNKLDEFSKKNTGFADWTREVNSTTVSVETLKTELDNVKTASDLRVATARVNEFESAFKAANATASKTNDLTEKLNRIQLLRDTGKFTSQISDVTADYNKLSVVTDELKADFKELNRLGEVLNTSADADELRQSYEQFNTTLQKVKNNISVKAVQGLMFADQKKIDSLAESVLKFRDNNTKMSKDLRGKFSGIYDRLIADTKLTEKEVEELAQQFANLKLKVRDAGQLGQSFGDKMKNAIQKFGEWGFATGIVTKLGQSIHRVYDESKKLNDVMTDLAMATDLIDSEMTSLADRYSDLGDKLNATTSDMIASGTEWIKQGQSIADTEKLITSAMVLDKVGKLENTQATEYLTSAMKGYQVAAKDTMGIVDKLSAVDMVSATDVGGLAEGMSQVANNANLAGVSMDKLLGYLAVIGETTQASMSEVGTSLNTIFSRMGNIKLARLKDYQNESGEDLSNVETVLRGEGISLRESSGDFKNFGEVLDEVASNWENYSEVSQRAIASAFAGVNQMENFLVLMEGYSKATEYTEKSLNSSGEAMEKFADYQKSVTAHTELFNKSIQDLARTAVDSGLVNFFIDMGTGAIKFLDGLTDGIKEINSLGGLLDGLGGTLGAISGLLMNKAGIGERTMFQW